MQTVNAVRGNARTFFTHLFGADLKREQGVHGDLKSGADQTLRAALPIPRGGEEQATVFAPLGKPSADRERGARIRQHVQGAQVGGQHGAHGQRHFPVRRVQDGSGHAPGHRVGQVRQVRLQEMFHKRAVIRFAPPPENTCRASAARAGWLSTATTRTWRPRYRIRSSPRATPTPPGSRQSGSRPCSGRSRRVSCRPFGKGCVTGTGPRSAVANRLATTTILISSAAALRTHTFEFRPSTRHSCATATGSRQGPTHLRSPTL